MAEDFDVEALLEAPYNNSTNGLTNKIKLENGLIDDNKTKLENDDRRRKRSRSKERRKRSYSRSRSKERRHRRKSRSKERKSSKRDRLSRERKHRRSRSKDKLRDRSKERLKDRSKERLREKSKERSRDKSIDRSRDRYRRRHDDDRSYSKRYRDDDYSPRKRSPSFHKEDRILEEADRRTVFCMQLAARVREIDLEEFFSRVGKVHEVRLIMDNKTRKHKGIAYIEFRDSTSVPLALQLNGQKLCGYPISIQPTHAEKNKSALSTSSNINSSAITPTNTFNHSAIKKQVSEPLRLYVGSLHFNVTENMLKAIFEPFGAVVKVELMRDTETLRSKGYGFITFANSAEAKKALEQMNGYELAGRPMKVNYVVERGPDNVSTSSSNGITLDSDELDRTGIDLGTKGRLQLMAKLAEGTGIQLPKLCIDALNQYTAPTINKDTPTTTQCFLLNNLFDPETESEEDWPEVIKEEVLSECRIHGGAVHIMVDTNSKGNVYIKATSIQAAIKCVAALHGRWFSGKLVTAAYISASSYHQLFPDSVNATTPL